MAVNRISGENVFIAEELASFQETMNAPFRGHLIEAHPDSIKLYEFIEKGDIEDICAFDFSILVSYEAVRMRERLEREMHKEGKSLDTVEMLMIAYDRFQREARHDENQFFEGLKRDGETANLPITDWNTLTDVLRAEASILNSALFKGSMLDNIVGAQGNFSNRARELLSQDKK